MVKKIETLGKRRGCSIGKEKEKLLNTSKANLSLPVHPKNTTTRAESTQTTHG